MNTEQYVIKDRVGVAIYRGGDRTAVVHIPYSGGSRYTHVFDFGHTELTIFARTPLELRNMMRYALEDRAMNSSYAYEVNPVYTQQTYNKSGKLEVCMFWHDYLEL